MTRHRETPHGDSTERQPRGEEGGVTITRLLRRQTTANPRAGVCWLCPSWFYGLTGTRAQRKLMAHVAEVHPRHGCGAAR